jgi:hypothetical protein
MTPTTAPSSPSTGARELVELGFNAMVAGIHEGRLVRVE